MTSRKAFGAGMLAGAGALLLLGAVAAPRPVPPSATTVTLHRFDLVPGRERAFAD